jgi:hypothetical protein
MKAVGSLIRVAVAVAILNAAVRVGFAYWAFYQLRDDAEQTALFGARQPTWALQQAVLEKANQLLLPVGEEQVIVTRNGPKTTIEASYVQPIEYFPRRSYPMTFSFAVEGFTVGDARAAEDGTR